MMLMKRSRSPQKDQHTRNLMHNPISDSYVHSNVSNQKPKSNSFLNVPGLFVGFNPWSGDSYSVRSPTSPLDFKIFSSFGNPFRGPKSQNEEQKKRWDRSKVGLSIIDSLVDATKPSEKLNTISSANKNIVFGPKMSVRNPNFVGHVSSFLAPNSLPKHFIAFSSTRSEPVTVRNNISGVVFEIGDENPRARSLDSSERGSHLTDHLSRKSRFGSGNLVPENNMTKPIPSEPMKWSPSPQSINPISVTVESISASDIENSEDYTRVITRGPNPKVTHIFADCILECNGNELTGFVKKNSANLANQDADHSSDVVVASYTRDDFLKCCYSCQKKLDGEDIYMYRGEKAFCSENCRLKEIETDEEMDKLNNPSSETSLDSKSCGEISMSESGLFITT